MLFPEQRATPVLMPSEFDFDASSEVRLHCRGRDSGCPLPPAQTRAGATNAHGSYLDVGMFGGEARVRIRVQDLDWWQQGIQAAS